MRQFACFKNYGGEMADLYPRFCFPVMASGLEWVSDEARRF